MSYLLLCNPIHGLCFQQQGKTWIRLAEPCQKDNSVSVEGKSAARPVPLFKFFSFYGCREFMWSSSGKSFSPAKSHFSLHRLSSLSLPLYHTVLSIVFGWTTDIARQYITFSPDNKNIISALIYLEQATDVVVIPAGHQQRSVHVIHVY